MVQIDHGRGKKEENIQGTVPPRWFFYRNQVKMGDVTEEGKAFEAAVFYNIYEKGNGEARTKAGTITKVGDKAIIAFKELIEKIKAAEKPAESQSGKAQSTTQSPSLIPKLK